MSYLTEDTSWKYLMMSAKKDEGERFDRFHFGGNQNQRMFSLLPLSLVDSLRVYSPPDPPGYFDGHVWPMYLKNRQEMENMMSDIGEVKDAVCVTISMWKFCWLKKKNVYSKDDNNSLIL